MNTLEQITGKSIFIIFIIQLASNRLRLCRMNSALFFLFNLALAALSTIAKSQLSNTFAVEHIANSGLIFKRTDFLL